MKSTIFHDVLPKLQSEWADNFLKVLSDVNFERGYKEKILNYKQSIEYLNSEIEMLNKSNLSGNKTWKEKFASFQIIANQICTTEEYQTVCEMADFRFIGNLLLIRRDPCYT